MGERNWTYVKLMFPNAKLLDTAVTALGDSDGFGEIRRSTPWFFLRYVDYYGPQLRLRLQAESANRLSYVRWAQAFYKDLLSADARAPRVEANRVPGRVGFDVASYQPEITKYGSIACVELVEDLWSAQCEDVIGYWQSPNTKSRRVETFAMISKDVMAQLFGTEEMTSLCRMHGWYWIRSTTPSQPGAKKFMELIEAIDRTDTHSHGSLNAALADSVVDTVARLTQLPGARLEPNYAFNLLHILANRLGLAPVEEGLVMLAHARQFERRRAMESAL